jgi:hypothetical protein
VAVPIHADLDFLITDSKQSFNFEGRVQGGNQSVYGIISGELDAPAVICATSNHRKKISKGIYLGRVSTLVEIEDTDESFIGTLDKVRKEIVPSDSLQECEKMVVYNMLHATQGALSNGMI